VCFNAIFLQTWVFTKFMRIVGEDFVQVDRQGFTFGIGDNPLPVKFDNGIRRCHPIEWFVGATITMNGDAAIGFHHDEAYGFGQCRIEATRVLNAATSDDETHNSFNLVVIDRRDRAFVSESILDVLVDLYTSFDQHSLQDQDWL